MSSGFVSGGTIDAPIERDEAWLTAQKEVEENFKRKAELARQNDGKSLFETLEANKAAKQDAFEEAAKLKHQFQSLNEDEVEFLDSILERTRADEHRLKKETQEGLALFRQQQEEADKKARRESDGAVEGNTIGEEESWGAGRKRKRKETDGLKGVKAGKLSTLVKSTKSAPAASADAAGERDSSVAVPESKDVKASTNKTDDISRPKEGKEPGKEKSPVVPAKSALSLVDYGSDDDDW